MDQSAQDEINRLQSTLEKKSVLHDQQKELINKQIHELTQFKMKCDEITRQNLEQSELIQNQQNHIQTLENQVNLSLLKKIIKRISGLFK